MSENKDKRVFAQRQELAAREGPPGILRTTLSYHEQSMLCHFRLQKGSTIPLHAHSAIQHGYLIQGRVRFLLDGGRSYTALPGSSWVFASDQRHGAEILEDSEVVEFFSPMRPEYADN